MDERAARSWVEREFDVPRETMARIDAFCALLRDENEHQNLVSKDSLAQVWRRHIADSAQLLRFAPISTGSWIDLGTGAGFPGLVAAALHAAGPVTLVEQRRLRADFLRRAAQSLYVEPEIIQCSAERIPPRPFQIISARAFAPLGRLLEIGTVFSTAKTIWLLPKGRNAESELAALDATWQGNFRLEPSVTDPDARIIVATDVRRRGEGKDE